MSPPDFGAWQVIGGGSAVYGVEVLQGEVSDHPYGPVPLERTPSSL